MELRKTFKKQGGWELIRKYHKSRCLGTAISQFALLGTSRTALEILRLSTQLKTKRFLEKTYRKEWAKIDFELAAEKEHRSSDKIWICWLQGIEQAPDIVKACYKSVLDNMSHRDVVLITENNYDQYVQFPDHIIEKWKKGLITHTHFTDLLRLELLIHYGGLWLDATVFCTRKEEDIPDYFFDSDLFFFQNLKPGRDGHAYYISSWLMSAKTNNKVLMAVRHLCYKYWETNNDLIDYFLLHAFVSIVLDHYPDDWNRIIPADSSAPHMLLLRIKEPYKKELWDAILDQTPFHKLSYKLEESDKEKKDTFYSKIIGY